MIRAEQGQNDSNNYQKYYFEGQSERSQHWGFYFELLEKKFKTRENDYCKASISTLY